MTQLKNADATWVQSVELDGDDGACTVKLNVPVADAGGTVAAYEEAIFREEMSRELQDKARIFVAALVDHVRFRQGVAAVGNRCATCTGACCGRVYSEVHVTPDDVERMGPVTAKRGVDFYAAVTWQGYAGILRRVPWKGVGKATFEGDEQPMACVFLDPKTSFCTIYDARPSVCRTFTSHDCDDHEEAPIRLVRLRRKQLADT